jgi:hypothetical protein
MSVHFDRWQTVIALMSMFPIMRIVFVSIYHWKIYFSFGIIKMNRLFIETSTSPERVKVVYGVERVRELEKPKKPKKPKKK